MISDRALFIAVVISLVTHGVILVQNPSFYFPMVSKKGKAVEVTYVKPPPEAITIAPIPTKEKESKEELPLMSSSNISAKKVAVPPIFSKGRIFEEKREAMLKEPNFRKPTIIQSDVISIKKIITLPPIDIDKINNPVYINYYQIVREKIRRAAYQNFTRTDVGEVYLSFIIAKNGTLKDTRLREEKSSPNPYLREIALKSINEASPFPAFPNELDYPQLSFNVVISFEIE